MNPSTKNWRPQRIGPGTRLRAPRAAAIAGIIFSVLLITSLLLLRRSVPVLASEEGQWFRERASTVSVAVNLVPFAGIAFLWFIGVLRDRLGDREDRLFATVFMGSGLLFLAMLFASASFVGGIVTAYGMEFDRLPGSPAFTVARAVAYEIMKQAGAIQLSTSDTVDTITPKDASTVGMTVTSNGQTGTYTESVDTFRSLVSG
jgi:hypothetical protein